MALDRYYTPRALAEATGLSLSQCHSLIMQSPDRICVSRSLHSKKPRWAISEKGFRELMEKHRREAAAQQMEADQPAQKTTRRKSAKPAILPGVTSDGKLMTSRQLKAAGLWRGA